MANSFRDYYEVLGISKNATEDEIKQAYRKLAREHHPDLHQGKDKAQHHTRMQEVNEAYSVLSSKENRTKYDQFGQHWKDGPPPPPPPRSERSQAGASFSAGDTDAFSEFFRQSFGGRSRAAEAEEMDLSELDIEATLEISLEDAVRGVEQSFSLTTAGLCHNCRGTGQKNGVFCEVCGGVGEINRQRPVKANVPPGLVEGSRIRLRGQGNEGARNRRGDLYLRIHLKPDPRFTIVGADLETPIKVAPWRAALGGELSIQTLDGPVRIKIPKGSHSGNRLRLSGKGLGKPGQRGDLFARIDVDNPPMLSPEIEALYKQMEEKSDARVS